MQTQFAGRVQNAECRMQECSRVQQVEVRDELRRFSARPEPCALSGDREVQPQAMFFFVYLVRYDRVLQPVQNSSTVQYLHVIFYLR